MTRFTMRRRVLLCVLFLVAASPIAAWALDVIRVYFVNKYDKEIYATRTLTVPCWCEARAHISVRHRRKNKKSLPVKGATVTMSADFTTNSGVFGSPLPSAFDPPDPVTDNGGIAKTKFEMPSLSGNGVLKADDGEEKSFIDFGTVGYPAAPDDPYDENQGRRFLSEAKIYIQKATVCADKDALADAWWGDIKTFNSSTNRWSFATMFVYEQDVISPTTGNPICAAYISHSDVVEVSAMAFDPDNCGEPAFGDVRCGEPGAIGAEEASALCTFLHETRHVQQIKESMSPADVEGDASNFAINNIPRNCE